MKPVKCPTRAEIVADAKRIKGDIDQIFADAAHWNSRHRGAERVDPDPGGLLVRLREGLIAMLAKEEPRV